MPGHKFSLLSSCHHVFIQVQICPLPSPLMSDQSFSLNFPAVSLRFDFHTSRINTRRLKIWGFPACLYTPQPVCSINLFSIYIPGGGGGGGATSYP